MIRSHLKIREGMQFSSKGPTETPGLFRTTFSPVTAVTVTLCTSFVLFQTLELHIGYKICYFKVDIKTDLKQQLVAAMSACFHCQFRQLSERLSILYPKSLQNL